MTLMRLPPVPSLDLPEWPTDVSDRWDRHVARATAVSRGVGTGTNFSGLVAEAKQLLRSDDQELLRVRVADRRFLRAVLTAWSDDADLARATMTPDAVGALTDQRKLSRLSTITALSLFFDGFDDLDRRHDDLFNAMRALVLTGVSSLPVARRADAVEAARANAPYLLDLTGPSALARDLVAQGADLISWFRRHQLQGWLDTRMGRRARDDFYLAQIDAADPERGDHGFLKPITSEVIARQQSGTDDAATYFGHQVLVALTSKETRKPSDAWLEALLSYAEDPRLRETPKWRLWWSPLPSVNLTRAVRWMQGVDLRAFLDGVQRYAEETGNEEMERMLERRSRLLLGLYEQDRVHDVRLVLGNEIRQYVRRSTSLPLDVANLRDAVKRDTAVVYLDCGDFSIVEGSHNFQLQVYIGEDGVPALADRSQRLFEASDLRDVYPARHERLRGQHAFRAFRHGGFKWVQDALDFLHGSGIRVDEARLLTRNDYAELERRRWWGR